MKMCRNSDKGQKPPYRGSNPGRGGTFGGRGRMDPWHQHITTRCKAPIGGSGSGPTSAQSLQHGPSSERWEGWSRPCPSSTNQKERFLLALALQRPMGAKAGERRAQSERNFHSYEERSKEIHWLDWICTFSGGGERRIGETDWFQFAHPATGKRRIWET